MNATNREEETRMEVSVENTFSGGVEEEGNAELQLEVYEDKEYDIEEVKYWNFVAKKRTPKPDIIRTLVYKVPEQTKTTIAAQTSKLMNPDSVDAKQQLNKSNSEIQITRVLTNNTSASNRNRFNKLNLTALDMAHYNAHSNKTSNSEYDQLDILKSNPIGSHYWSQQATYGSKNENKYNDKRHGVKRLPDEIQPLKSIQQDVNINEQRIKSDQLIKKKNDRPTIVIETDEPAPIYAKPTTRKRNISQGSVNSGGGKRTSETSNKRTNEVYHLRQSKRKTINYNENRVVYDIYNFDDNNDDIDHLGDYLNDSADDADLIVSDVNDDDDDDDDDYNNNKDDDEDDIDFINQKMDEDDEDFDVKIERKKSSKSSVSAKNKAFKSTNSPKQPVGRPRRKSNKKQNENIYSKVYKPPAATVISKAEETGTVEVDTIPDDMRVTRRLSLRRASINRASTNSNEILLRKEDNEESDGNRVNSKKFGPSNRKSLRGASRKDSNSSIDRFNSRPATPSMDADTDTNSTNVSVKPKRKYRSYLSVLRDSAKSREEEKAVNKKLLEDFKNKHGNVLKHGRVFVTRIKVIPSAVKSADSSREEKKEDQPKKDDEIVVNKEAEKQEEEQNVEIKSPETADTVQNTDSTVEEHVETKEVLKLKIEEPILNENSMDSSNSNEKATRRSTRLTRNKAKLT